MVQVQVEFNQGQWNTLRARLRNKRTHVPLTQAAAYMEAATKQRFIQEVDPDGRPWQPLAASTITQKTSGTKLRETGRLFNSIGYDVRGDEARIFTTVEYAPYLQLGTRKMVARPFLGFSNRDKREINGIFARYYSL